MESSASSVSSKDSKRSLIWSHFTQIGSDNTNMIRSVCNHCKKRAWIRRDQITTRFDSKFQIIAQPFIRFEMKKHYWHSTTKTTFDGSNALCHRATTNLSTVAIGVLCSSKLIFVWKALLLKFPKVHYWRPAKPRVNAEKKQDPFNKQLTQFTEQ